ncbi:archaellin/type IV pilin N-terminal domain-containing protein [Nanoarchaeota archaeon]
MNKKALSPLVATVLLVVFALILGIITMNFGRSIDTDETPAVTENFITISVASLDNELKHVQVDYLLGRLSLDEYLQKEKEALQDMET